MAKDFPASPDTTWTVREAHIWASCFLAARGVLYPERNAEWLVRHLLKWDSVKWLTGWNEPLPVNIRQEFRRWVERRGNREPLQYILGEAEFFGRTFKVTPDVLIPRPETECLVEHVMDRIHTVSIPKNRPLRIVDIGVGSGAIAVTLALELNPKMNDKCVNFEIHGVDLSAAALQIARENARELGAQVIFHQGDGLQPMLEQGIVTDIVVSNPPYIPDREMEDLQVEIRDFEPHLALKGGQDGMDPYRLLIQQCEQQLQVNDPQLIAFEVGQGQARSIADMLGTYLGLETRIYTDLAGIERIVIGARNFGE